MRLPLPTRRQRDDQTSTTHNCCRRRKSAQIWRHKMASEFGGDVNDKGATKAPLASWVEEDQNGGSVVSTSCKVTRSLRSGSSSVSS